MSDLTIKHNLNSGLLELILEGSLNEGASFGNIDLSSVQEMFIDFNGLGFINSTGIGKWVKWMQVLEVDHPGITLNFCNCPKIIIDQVNAVRGFLPKTAKIESFWLPYYCEESDRREFILLSRGKDYMEETSEGKDWVNMPDCNCSETQTPCEPDIMPAKYFSFLKKKS